MSQLSPIVAPTLWVVLMLVCTQYRGVHLGAEARHNEPNPILMKLYNHRGINYYGLIKVGTPAKEFKVLVRTHRGTSWLISNECRTDFCKTRTRYNGNESSTFLDTSSVGTSHSIVYPSICEVSLNSFYDRAEFGNGTSEMFLRKATNVNLLNNAVDLMQFDGVLSLSHTYKDTFIDDLYFRKSVPSTTYSIHLNKNNPTGVDSQSSSAGHLLLGGIDKRFHRGEIKYLDRSLPVTIQFDGSSTINSLSHINAQRLQQRLPKPLKFYGRLVLDTGLNYFAAQRSQVEPLARSLGAFRVESGLYRFAGCFLDKLPNMVISIGSKTNFTLTPQEYTFRTPSELDSSVEICMLGVAEVDEPTWTWALGNAFIKKYYTVIDDDRNRLGFAESVDVFD